MLILKNANNSAQIVYYLTIISGMHIEFSAMIVEEFIMTWTKIHDFIIENRLAAFMLFVAFGWIASWILIIIFSAIVL